MVTLEEIKEARERIRDRIYESPLAKSEFFSNHCGCKAFFKLENLQITGSFKERGALNKILTLSNAERESGIITASAGNHAQAVAYHAHRLGIDNTVVMPKRTPLIKVQNTRNFGGNVVLEGDNFDAAYQHAKTLEAERGLTFVHPFDDDAVIAGQGSIALELMEQQPDLEVIIVPIGGGGVIAGIATAYKALRPEVHIVGVETTQLPSMRQSVEAGERLSLPPAHTIADGIAVKRPGERTLEIVRRCVDEIVLVDEEEIANAILLLLEREKTVAEGAGATPLAALYNGHVEAARGKNTAMVLCGGNIDVNLLSRIIERGLIKDGRLIRLQITVPDRPGALAGILGEVARAEANVLEIHHHRAFSDLGLGEVDIELRLETRGEDHAREIIEQLSGTGCVVHANVVPAASRRFGG
ncbi:MAG: threonine ammonia-lyase [Acidobacteriota bacterium]